MNYINNIISINAKITQCGCNNLSPHNITYMNEYVTMYYNELEIKKSTNIKPCKHKRVNK